VDDDIDEAVGGYLGQALVWQPQAPR